MKKMWPFRKHKALSHRDVVEDLKAFREVGETFDHLGATMVVTGHERWMKSGVYPALECDYLDRNGQINSIYFLPRNIPMLKQLQKDGVEP